MILFDDKTKIKWENINLVKKFKKMKLTYQETKHRMMIWTKENKKTDMSQHTELVVQLWVWDNSLQSKLNKTIEVNSQANQMIKCEVEKNINYKKISKTKISQPRLL